MWFYIPSHHSLECTQMIVLVFNLSTQMTLVLWLRTRTVFFIFLLMSRVSVQMFKKSLFFFQCTLHFLCLFFRWVLFLWFVGMVHQIVFHCVFWFYCFLICGNIYPLFSWHSQSLLTCISSLYEGFLTSVIILWS